MLVLVARCVVDGKVNPDRALLLLSVLAALLLCWQDMQWGMLAQLNPKVTKSKCALGGPQD
jgi:hypothetical protein